MPEGWPWMIFSPRKAHLLISSWSALDTSCESLLVFLWVESPRPSTVLPTGAWIWPAHWSRTAARQTEKAAEEPRPAPTGSWDIRRMCMWGSVLKHPHNSYFFSLRAGIYQADADVWQCSKISLQYLCVFSASERIYMADADVWQCSETSRQYKLFSAWELRYQTDADVWQCSETSPQYLLSFSLTKVCIATVNETTERRDVFDYTKSFRT